MGNAVAELLHPFGVDVDINVQKKEKEDSKEPAPQTSGATENPSTSSTKETPSTSKLCFEFLLMCSSRFLTFFNIWTSLFIVFFSLSFSY